MNQIFISYRRSDSAFAAGRLYDRLKQSFGSENVFMDIDSIDLGIDFAEHIERAVGTCDVLVAIIGRSWLQAAERGRRLLDNPDDFVRIEIEAALKRNIFVIPVLVDRAEMPAERELPPALASSRGEPT